MTIVLTILKIIGLILLTLLGLLLAALLFVLFVPIRYRVDGAYQGAVTAKAQITWLFRFLSVKAAFDGGLQYCVRVAGIRLLPKKKKRQKRAKSGGKEDGDDCSEAQKEAEVLAENDDGQKDSAKESAETGEENERITETEENKDFSGEEETPQPPFLALPGRIWDIFLKCREKYRGICRKIRKVWDNLSYYIQVLEREETKRALSNTFAQLQRIVRHILPKNLDVCFCIGTGDPASTGQLLALQGMLYPVLQSRVRIVPDFDEKRIEGTFHAKGRIRTVTVLICGLRVLINKNFRQLIKLLRKKEEA